MDYEKGSVYKQQDEDFVKNLRKAYHNKNILPLLLKNFDREQEIKVLEYGPGLGIMADILHENYPSINYTAVDINQNVLERIKDKHVKSEVKKINSSNELGEFLKINRYDVIIALDVWEHIPSTELNKYIEISLEHLNNAGIFIAQVPNWGCPFAPNVIFAGDITHCNPFNEISARQLLIKSGTDNKNIQILPYYFPRKGFLNLVRSFIRPLFLMMYKLILALLGLQVLSICTPNLIMLVKNNESASKEKN